ncbi:MAG: hypothetical protein PHT31_05265 [Candidatus Omnitrophica bacterium]|nr:hypothetical protein [Candidatus Omnitrophota bacterium]
MGKKELLKEKFKKEYPRLDDNLGAKPKFAAFSGKLFAIIKFILGVCLLPFVYTTTVSFLSEFSLIEGVLQSYFWYGISSFLVIYLFIWEPTVIYTKGQRILEIIFTFVRPLVRVAPFLLPIYFIILMSAYGLVYIFNQSAEMRDLFVFLFGFSMVFHLVFSAKSLRTKQEDFLKANYIFGFSFLYLVNLMLLAFLFSFIFAKFSFVNFCNLSYQSASNIFTSVFSQLFMNK